MARSTYEPVRYTSINTNVSSGTGESDLLRSKGLHFSLDYGELKSIDYSWDSYNDSSPFFFRFMAASHLDNI